MATHSHPIEQQYIDTSRFELVDGHLMERPSPGRTHAETQLAVVVLLRQQARLLGCTALQEWTLDQNDQIGHAWMTPDVLVAANEQARAESEHLLPPAILAVEILSSGQTVAEMRLKALRYFQWGVENVWIIDPESQAAVTMQANEPGRGLLIYEGDLIAGAFKLSLADIFRTDL